MEKEWGWLSADDITLGELAGEFLQFGIGLADRHGGCPNPLMNSVVKSHCCLLGRTLTFSKKDKLLRAFRLG